MKKEIAKLIAISKNIELNGHNARFWQHSVEVAKIFELN